ncbi:MAG: helix-turn-helix transcriptional regulator [Rhodocyclaceae bacterium]|nr:helix-turn-helix transcriptional regulator [Rhodocyclaceae bacterium]
MFDDDIRRETLRNLLKEARLSADLRQQDVAVQLQKPQSYVAKIESGERKIDLIETLDYCAATGADPLALVKKLVR